MFGRVVRSVDFERVLRCPPWARSAHFALHHLASRPTPASKPLSKRAAAELSTGHVPVAAAVVDDLPAEGPDLGHWLGLVLPKRHARRAVTRNLLRRQIRAALAHGGSALPPGLWVLRLRAPFDRAQFPSAASAALRDAARDELARLVQRPPRPPAR